ncbi:hypothetical protein [Microvirga solisilvae]|uniref:hypothetical protein n=1 Tax=Microvirga solisilvae TaxID=2919498 RepID=UPI001FAFD869|nr:hypothetical protein [Microvirga solisilvae]
MLLSATRLCVLTGAALLAGGIAFADSGIDASQLSQAFKNALLQDRIASKGDRLAVSKPAEHPASISIVEIVGLSRATVILRDSNGEVLYRADPGSGVTTISKNTELPVLTVKEDAYSPAVQHPPVITREGSEEPRKIKRQPPVGCLDDVSPLASAAKGRMPSMCLASLGHSVS